MSISKFACSVLLLSFSFTVFAQPSNRDITHVMAKINHLRSSGCQCGETYMPPVAPVRWSHHLYKVSAKYAMYMHRYDHFEHISREGDDLGDRLDASGYDWVKVGENLGKGYKDFYGVFSAWIESPSHCRMLMDPDMTEMGMSKKGLYWAQSWAKPNLGLSANLGH